MALLKYGHENFTFEIIKYCEPKEAVILEQTYLDNYDFDYNINAKANSILGYKHTQETLDKMKGRQNFKGKKHSEETIQGIRDRANLIRQAKQLKNNIKLSDLFNKNNISSNSNSVKKKNIRVKVTVTDIFTNQSIFFNTITLASSVLCANESTLKKYAEEKKLFSYFE
jgi:group I intron endonuclease